MDLLKKNIFSVLCGVVAILCVVAVFFPFSGMFAGLQEQLGSAKKIGDDIKQVRDKPRTWPTLSAREEDRVPLRDFPTESAYRVGDAMTKGWTQRAANFLFNALGLQTTRLQLLVPGSLPAPSRTLQFQFLDAYRERFGLKVNNNGEPELEQSLFRQVLNGGLPPSQADVKLQQDNVAADTRAKVERSVGGVVENQEQVTQEVAEAVGRVAERLRNERGLRYSVYVDPATSLTPHPKIAGAVAPSPNDMFNAQVMLWVQEDLCHAIREVNSVSKRGVLDAPIKNLIKLNVLSPYQAVSPAAGAPADAPVLPPPPTAKLTMNYLENPLGHVSNDFYDVVKFDINFVCEADTLPQTIAGLSRNRLVMFRDLRMTSVDGAVAFAQGYLYGNKPVVQISAKGQYLMLRSFIGPYMPPDIIRGLTMPATPGAAGGMPSFPGMEGDPSMGGAP